MEKRSGDV